LAVEKIDDALLAEIEAHAIAIAGQAGRILHEQFRRPLEVQFKGKKNSDPVTTADRLSDEYLKGAIKEKFPSHSIVSEEGGKLSESDSPFVWVLDPLDGTANYINGLPLYAVSVGVLWKRQPVAGSIYVPVSQHGAEGVYHGRLGRGAFFNNEKIEVNLKPTGRPLSEIPVQLGGRFRLSGKSRKEPYEARNLGSIALELALAAGGVFQWALFGSPKLWDAAAGVLLVKEAGGLSFIRRPRGKDWLVLERFQAEQEKDSETLESLRAWSFPLLVGAPEAARNVSRDIRVPRNPRPGGPVLVPGRQTRSRWPEITSVLLGTDVAGRVDRASAPRTKRPACCADLPGLAAELL
jgi:myo-inositol-1(or 4)-monophosphatase